MFTVGLDVFGWLCHGLHAYSCVHMTSAFPLLIYGVLSWKC